MALHWASERYEKDGINLNPASLCLCLSSQRAAWLLLGYLVSSLWGQLRVLCLSCPVVPLAQGTIYLGFISDLS